MGRTLARHAPYQSDFTHFLVLHCAFLGILLGALFPEFAKNLAPISNIFLRLIKSIVGPLLFGTLVSGIASAGELKVVGRIALKAVAYFETATTFALVIGLIVVNLARPGAGLSLAAETSSRLPALAKPASLNQILEHAVSASIFESLAQNDVLQMVVSFSCSEPLFSHRRQG